MNSITELTIALDVDGTLSPVTGMGTGEPANKFDNWTYKVLSGRNFGAAVANDVVALLKTLARDGATIKWHTSWGDAAPNYLGPELDLPPFELFSPVVGSSTARWWKMEAVEEWIAATEGTDQRLVWIDDDIDDAVFSGEIPSELLQHPRVSMISPNVYWGLSPSDLENLSQAAYSDTRINLVNDPSDPRPLPIAPGSVIAWGELEDPATGERWAATATAIQSPDGEIVWADAFVDDENSSSLFATDHLNSVEWLAIIETVRAEEAPASVRSAFDNGDTVLGAVFEAELDDIPSVTFTTAAGVLYAGEVSEIYAVDIYGNLNQSDQRRPLYLPTELL